jgi:hypothetical protein
MPIEITSSNIAIAASAPTLRIGLPGQPSVQEWTNECVADLKVAQGKLKKLPTSALRGAGDRLLRAIEVYLESTPSSRPTPSPSAEQPTVEVAEQE